MSTLSEREDAVVRSILSGNNRCGALQSAVGNQDDAYFRQAVRPTLQVYEDEAECARKQRDIILVQSEKRRQALEFVIANTSLPSHIVSVVADALDRPLA